MSGDEFKIKIGLDKPGVDPGLKETSANLANIGESAVKAGAAAKPALDSIGMSAKATAAAMRGIPAQFTDIVTSLQAGQSPMTVLLQQGGQLKDMFGGVGPAARAMGSYIVGLINPLTLAAGTIGVLALAYAKGAEEQENFARTLIMTGGVAGVSAGQLMDAARSVSASTGATQGSVAEIMNSIVASGKVSAEVLGKVTKAAVNLERAGGPAAADTAKEFASLGDKPVEAVLKLNEKYHIFTATVFEHIKSLAAQGKEAEATRVAQLAYADAIEGRVPSLAQNLGLLERAWKGVSDGAKGAWDSMLGVGRERSLDQQLQESLRKNTGEANSITAMFRQGAGGASSAQQKKIDALSNEIEARDSLLLIQKKSNELNDAKIKQINDLSKYLADQSNAPKVAKLAADIDKENKAFETAVSGLEKTDASYVRALKAHNERVTELRTNAARGQKDPAQEAAFLHSDQMQRLFKEAGDESDKIKQANEKRARAQQIVTNYNNQAAQTVERITRQNELIGVSEREVLVKKALFKVEDEAAQVRKEITQQIKDEADRTAALAAVDADLANKKLLVADATRQAYDASRTFDAGWSDAFQKYQDNATNAADTARSAFSGMSGAMEGAIKSFVKTGKIDFKSFGDAVISTLIDIQMQSLRTNVLSPLMKDAGGWMKGLFDNRASLSSSESYVDGFDSLGALPSANGNVFSGAPGLHRYVNTVQSSPKFFGFNALHKFASGGVFAEAGPEAVMPLSRDHSGRLGVIANGGGSNIVINLIESPGSGKGGTTQTRNEGGMSIVNVFVEQIKGAIASDIGSGGVVSGAMETTYGLNRAAGAWR